MYSVGACSSKPSSPIMLMRVMRTGAPAAVARGNVDERGPRFGRDVAPDVRAVAHAAGRAGDDVVLVFGNTRDRDIGLDAAARIEHRRVNDASPPGLDG